MSKIILTGVTPSGDALHIGNYFGALKPLVDLGESGEQVYCFVADLHALTTVQDKKTLEHNIRQVIINYLACGVDSKNFIFFRQSQVTAHSELTVILNNFISFGQMKRMHAYKDKLQKGVTAESINMGLFNYPILMAADILLYHPDLVPVGADQKQHVEVARDIALNFNKKVQKEVFKLPEPLIDMKVGKIVGIDGQRKMSKSLGNIIGIFDDYQVIEKQIMKAFTDSGRQKITDKGKVEHNPIFIYHDLWNQDKTEVVELKKKYRLGQIGDVEVKKRLLQAHKHYFKQIRARKAYYDEHPLEIEKILNQGASLARLTAEINLARVKKALGLEVNFTKENLFFDEQYQRPLISFSDFLKLELRVGKVLQASLPTWSDKLIEQKVDFGPLGVKTIYSAMRTWYKVEDFQNHQFVYITNIPPRKMGQKISEGMIVAVNGKDKPERWQVSKAVSAGALVN